MKVLRHNEVAAEMGKWGPGLRLCCDECGGKGFAAVVEFIAEGAAHHVCHPCLVKAEIDLRKAFGGEPAVEDFRRPTVFLTKKQAERHLKRALAIVQQNSPYKLIRTKPDPGFSMAYNVFDKKGFQVGAIEREEDGSKCWWIRKGTSDCQEGIGFSARWAALKHLESINRGENHEPG